mmetsp:Transcript_7463/g.27418  ORF Transcript_7463/g.27418 Transcript_7463/m.27418 type:complete len:209 (+) Transcript_7463:115-741(+)
MPPWYVAVRCRVRRVWLSALRMRARRGCGCAGVPLGGGADRGVRRGANGHCVRHGGGDVLVELHLRGADPAAHLRGRGGRGGHPRRGRVRREHGGHLPQFRGLPAGHRGARVLPLHAHLLPGPLSPAGHGGRPQVGGDQRAQSRQPPAAAWRARVAQEDRDGRHHHRRERGPPAAGGALAIDVQTSRASNPAGRPACGAAVQCKATSM